MTDYIRNPLTYVWAVLVAVTVASWLISQSSGERFKTDITITLSVLVIAAAKVHLVMRYYIEARHAPDWLKRVVYGWNVILLLLLLGNYWIGI